MQIDHVIISYEVANLRYHKQAINQTIKQSIPHSINHSIYQYLTESVSMAALCGDLRQRTDCPLL